MIPINHIVNNRSLTAFAPLSKELEFNSSKNYLFDLSHLSILSVIGDKAQEFLQGQLSCDLRKVDKQTMQQGALCDLKGRVGALMDVVYWSDKDVRLILPEDLLTQTQASLAKPAMFSKVTVEKNNDYECFGFYSQQPQDITPFDLNLNTIAYTVVYDDNICCYALGDDFYLLLVKTSVAPALRDRFIKQTQYRGSLAWHALQLRLKRMEIYPESRGLFLPHRLNLQNTGYLSFDKGCYKGQEIIARTHYRATLKHELRLIEIHTNEVLASGLNVLSDDQVVGEVIDYCPIKGDTYLVLVSILMSVTTGLRIGKK
jgi:folate-binding protein YgfZ